MEPLGIFLILIPIGLAIGIIASLLGLGGGSMMVPTLFFGIFLLTTFQHEKSMIYATTISSTVIIFVGVSSTIAYAVQKRIDYPVGILCAVFTIGGALLGKTLQPYFGDEVITIIFSVLLLVSGIRMVYEGIKELIKYERYDDNVIDIQEIPLNALDNIELKDIEIVRNPATITRKGMVRLHVLLDTLTKERRYIDGEGKFWYFHIRFYFTPLALLAGLLAGLAGESGGILMVPILHILLGMPMHFSIATSAFIMIFTSSASFIGAVINPDISLVGIWWPFIAGLILGLIPGTQLGSLLSKKIKGASLKLIFSLLVFGVVIWSLLKLFLYK
jgi:hypothetical protein